MRGVSGNSFRCVPVASGNSCANVRHLPCLLHKYPTEKSASILKTMSILSLINHKIRCMNTKFIQRILDFIEHLWCVCSEIYFRCVRGLGRSADAPPVADKARCWGEETRSIATAPKERDDYVSEGHSPTSILQNLYRFALLAINEHCFVRMMVKGKKLYRFALLARIDITLLLVW